MNSGSKFGWRVLFLCLSLNLALVSVGGFAPAQAAQTERSPDLSALKDQELRQQMRKLMAKNHRAIDYSTARREIVGELHVRHGKDGDYIRDVYCLADYPVRSPGGEGGQMKAGSPYIGTVNVEHTWPQSKFTPGPISGTMKSDLHHLFPADKDVNNSRANNAFGEVNGRSESLKCDKSRLGEGPRGPIFEPPDSHKGNVARALFYFAVRYGMSIDSDQEKALRAWNRQDPVDEEERVRNERIEEIQGNRNLFIDHPEFAERISDF